MAKGNYLVRGDKTTCGGFITEGCEDHCLFGKAIAREGDKVTCGQHPGMYNIVGGIANDSVHGRRMAGTLDSYSSCPCRARFTASMVNDTYEKAGRNGGESEQYVQPAKKDVAFDSDSDTNSSNESKNANKNERYGRKIVIVDYENEKPVPYLNVQVSVMGMLFYYEPDGSGGIDTVFTEKSNESIIVDVYPVANK